MINNRKDLLLAMQEITNSNTLILVKRGLLESMCDLIVPLSEIADQENVVINEDIPSALHLNDYLDYTDYSAIDSDSPDYNLVQFLDFDDVDGCKISEAIEPNDNTVLRLIKNPVTGTYVDLTRKYIGDAFPTVHIELMVTLMIKGKVISEIPYYASFTCDDKSLDVVSLITEQADEIAARLPKTSNDDGLHATSIYLTTANQVTRHGLGLHRRNKFISTQTDNR